MNTRWLPAILFVLSFLSAGVALAAETVNLNKADAAAIQQSLIGIGPVKAEAIISYRKKNGKFSGVDDLLNVKGIGPGLIKKNKKYLSLSKGVVKGDAKKYAAVKKQAKAKQSGSSSTKSSKKSKTAKATSKSSTSKSKAVTAKSTSTKKSTSKTASKSKKKSKTDKSDKTKKTSKSKSTKKKAKKKKKKAPAS